MLNWIPTWLRKFILASNYTNTNNNNTNNNNDARDDNKYDTVKDQGRSGSGDQENSTSATTSPNGQRSSQIDQIASKASLIYFEVNSFNRAVAADKAAGENIVLEQNLKLVKFLDNLFIVASLTCVGVAVLVEVYL